MLDYTHMGTFIIGQVQSFLTQPRNRKGKSEKGTDFDFWQQTLTVAVDGKMITLNWTTDKEPIHPLSPDSYPMHSIIKFRVYSVRDYKGAISYECLPKD